MRALPRLVSGMAMALWAHGAHAAALDEACDPARPAAEVHVRFTPSAAQIDDTRLAREIRLDEHTHAAYLHLGVTRATLQREVEVKLEGYVDPESGQACAWPKVNVRLSVRPLMIELAHELEASPCLRSHVLDHELQHIAIYNAAASFAAHTLEHEMLQELSAHLLEGESEALLRDVRLQVDQRWLPRLDALIAEAGSGHERLDADEQNQVESVCNGILPQILRTMR
jgi:hypothetical protein